MRGVNKVFLIGNLGRDPDFQHPDGNAAMAKFPLATTETYKDKNGTLVSQTEWHNIVLWRGLAELAQKHLHKGSTVYIEGRIRTRNSEDKDRNRKVTTEIVADNLIMLDKRKDHVETQGPDNSAAEGTAVPYMNYDGGSLPGNITKDDLPF